MKFRYYISLNIALIFGLIVVFSVNFVYFCSFYRYLEIYTFLLPSCLVLYVVVFTYKFSQKVTFDDNKVIFSSLLGKTSYLIEEVSNVEYVIEWPYHKIRFELRQGSVYRIDYTNERFVRIKKHIETTKDKFIE